MVDIALIILIFSLAVALAGVVVWVVQLLSKRSLADPSPPKGSTKLGVFYAFTLGMLPWKKESARLHWLVYLRGILFHLGIFAGIFVLLLSLFTSIDYPALNLVLSIILGLGVISGVAAILLRLFDPRLRAISMPDDYISPILVTLFLVAATLFVWDEPGRTFFYVSTSILCLYLPWSKVRHCVYFFFSRAIFGAMLGHRGFLMKPTSDSRRLRKETE